MQDWVQVRVRAKYISHMIHEILRWLDECLVEIGIQTLGKITFGRSYFQILERERELLNESYIY